MTLVGFPDFQEQAQWQSPPAVLYAQAFANNATITFPLTGPQYFNVSNWMSTQLSIFFGGGPVDVSMFWYDAIPFTQLLGTRNFTARGTASQVITVPNIGPYLKVQITNQTGGASTLQVAILFTNRVAPPFSNPTGQPPLVRGFTPIAAGGTLTTVATYLYAGPASLFVYTNSNENWRGEVYGKTSNGATYSTTVINNQAPGQQGGTVSIVLPPLPVSLDIANNGAAAHDFSATITADVFH